MRPYSIVDNEGFTNMLNVLEPRYEVPSRTYFSANIIPNLHKKVKSKVEKRVESGHLYFINNRCVDIKDR